MVLRIGILAAELLVEQCRVACATLLQEALELLSHLWVEDVACLLEGCKRISIQYGCPCVAIVASCITRGEDMVVEGRAIAGNDFWNHVHVLHRLCLKCVHIKWLGAGHLVIVHIKDRRTEQFGLYEALIEGACLVDLSY